DTAWCQPGERASQGALGRLRRRVPQSRRNARAGLRLSHERDSPMRRAALLLLALPLLAACESGTPPAADAPVRTAAVTSEAASTAAQSPVPAGARALIGTWSASLAQCGEPAATTVIAATNFASG